MENSKLGLWELKAQKGTKSRFCVAPSSMQDSPSMWDPPSVWDPSPMWESSYLWWWFPGYIHTLKVIIKTLYALNMCSLLYISYTSIKLLPSQNQPPQVRELLWTLEMSWRGSRPLLFRDQNGSSLLPFSFPHTGVPPLGDFPGATFLSPHYLKPFH